MSEHDFLVSFRKDHFIDAIKFMKNWDEVDKEGNGYIKTADLKGFLEKLGVNEQSKSLADKIISLYEKNNDGKLGLAEASKLLQTDQNILKAFVDGENLTEERFDGVFNHYDQDKNGTIKGCELRGFLKDMKETQDDTVESNELKEYEIWIMGEADTNGDGELSKDELKKLFFG